MFLFLLEFPLIFYLFLCTSVVTVNPLMGILKPQSNGTYSNTVIGTLAVDGWAVTFGTARRGLRGLWPIPVLFSPPPCTKM